MVSPGDSRVRVTEKRASQNIPIGIPVGATRSISRPRVTRGGTCPALQISTSPVRSARPRTSVAKWLGPARFPNRLLGREIEVALERLALRPRQVIEAVLHQRVGHETVGLDRLVAGVTDAESTLVHARQGGVHLVQQAADLFIAGNRACGALELLAPFRELVAQEGFNRAGHLSPHALFLRALAG